MAAITINATLSEQDIKRAALATEKTFKQTFDNVGKFAQDAARRFADAIGGGNVQQALAKVRQLRETINALDIAAANQHARRLVEIEQRTANQRQLIEQRRIAQLETTRARQEASEQRHQQRLLEIQQRGTQQQSASLAKFGQSLQQVGLLASGLSLGIAAISRTAVKSAIDIDSNVNVLKAFTGSAEAAEKRLAQLIATASKTPGLTTNLALTLDAQLRAARVSAEAIDKLLPVIGRINAVRPLADPGRFAQNLIQLITQGFERADLKELVGQSPVAGNLVRQLFNVDSPTNAKAIRESAQKLGITTADEFFKQLAAAAENSPELQRVTESIGTQFEKLRDRVLVALRPLGLEIIKTLEPIVKDLVPLIESVTKAFADLSPETRRFIVILGGVAVVAGPALIALGSLFSVLGQLRGAFVLAGAAAGAQGLAGALAGLNPVTVAIAGAAVALGITWYETSRRMADSATVIENAFNRVRGLEVRGLDNQVLISRVDPGNPLFAPRPGERPALRVSGSPGLSNTFTTDPQEIERRLRGQIPDGAALNNSLRLNFSPARVGGGGGRTRGPQQSEREKELDAIRDFLVAEEIRTLKDFRDRQDSLKEAEEKLKEARAEFTFNANLKFGGSRLFDEQERVIDPRVFAGEQARGLFEARDLSLRRQEVEIQNQIQLGVLNEVEGRQLILAAQREARDELIKFLELQKGAATTAAEVEQLNLQIAQLKTLGVEVNNTTKFMNGFGSEIVSVGDIFDRFGQNVSRAFRNVTDLFNGLKNAVKNFFLDLVGNTLQRLVKGTLDTLFGALNGRQQAGGGGGGGGIIGTILNAFISGAGGTRAAAATTPNVVSNLLTGGGGGAGNAGIALGGSFGNVVNGIISVFRSGNVTDGGGLTAPPSLSVGNFGLTIPSFGAAGGGGFLGKALGGLSNNLFAGGLVSALPALLGVGLGAGLGGQSTLGKILGGIGGGAVGLGLSFGAAVGSAGGGFGAAALAALGPIALVGVPLLIGAILLGRAKQRKKDEQLTGEFLTDAITQIRALKKEADAGRLLDVTEARKIFESEIMTTFINQVNTIKTKSVRESRLTNQTRDLRALFEAEVVPAVVAAKTRGETFGKLVPEFHGGILNAHETFARVLKNESIVTAGQRAIANRMAGFDVLAAAGVPGTIGQTQNGVPVAHNGGTFTGAAPAPVIVFENVTLALSPDDATRILGAAIRTPDGKRHVYGTVKDGRRDGAL